jgi:hypothetical protein
MASKNPQVLAIQKAATAQFGKKASRKKFDWMNEQRVAQGLPPEKKTRGGLAGTYDRNKKVIMPALTIGAGLLTGGLAAPAVVGALKGFDREGKGGIGFDVGKGVRGGLEGAAIGGATQLASGAVRGGLSAMKGGTSMLGGAKSGALGTSTGQRLLQIGGKVKSGVQGALGAGGVDAAAGAPGAAAAAAGAGRAPLNWADYLSLGTGALGAIDAYGRTNAANREAGRQYDAASGMNAEAMKLLPGMTERVGDYSGGPDLSYLSDTDNPYVRKMRRPLAPPAVAL